MMVPLNVNLAYTPAKIVLTPAPVLLVKLHKTEKVTVLVLLDISMITLHAKNVTTNAKHVKTLLKTV